MTDPIADIRRELLAAAKRQAAIARANTAAPTRQRAGGRTRWRESPMRRRAALGTPSVILLAAGVAFAASRIDGAAVPRSGFPLVGSAQPESLRLLPVREPDPTGGPPWGVVYYLTKPAPASAPATCLQVGRIVGGRLGVLGQDGAFSDDHLFHPLPVLPTPCTSSLVTIGPTVIPASGLASSAGFVGVPNTAGGCATATEKRAAQSTLNAHHARVDGPGQRPTPAETRVAQSTAADETCPGRDLRVLFYGLVKPTATTVELIGPGVDQTETLPPGDHGGFVFALPLNGARVPGVDQVHLIVR